MKKLIFFTLITVLFFVGCGSPKADGTLHGTVVWECGKLVPFPSIIMTRQHSSPLAPPQIGGGGQLGEFFITLPGGKYILQLAPSPRGPYYTWPEVVKILPSTTTQRTFILPDVY